MYKKLSAPGGAPGGRSRGRSRGALQGLRPLFDPPPGALPLDPAGGPPFRLALRALAMIPPLANPGSATEPKDAQMTVHMGCNAWWLTVDV